MKHGMQPNFSLLLLIACCTNFRYGVKAKAVRQ